MAINAHSSFSAVHYSTLNKIVVTQSNGVGTNTTDFQTAELTVTDFVLVSKYQATIEYGDSSFSSVTNDTIILNDGYI